jgi:hypothetical protein
VLGLLTCSGLQVRWIDPSISLVADPLSSSSFRMTVKQLPRARYSLHTSPYPYWCAPSPGPCPPSPHIHTIPPSSTKSWSWAPGGRSTSVRTYWLTVSCSLIWKLGIFFYPGVAGNSFLQNAVIFLPDCTASHPRTQLSSKTMSVI